MKKLPLFLTLLRIALVPVIVVVYYLPNGHTIAAVLFLLASATDYLDGYFARKNKSITAFGAFLDPVADKLLVAVALVLIVSDRGHAYLAIPASVIISREIVISALREWMADIGKRTTVAVSQIAKIKTGLQMFAITVLLLSAQAAPNWLSVIGDMALATAAALTLWSMTLYLQAAWPDIRDEIKP